MFVHSVYSFTHVIFSHFLMCLSYCIVSVLPPLGQLIIVKGELLLN